MSIKNILVPPFHTDPVCDAIYIFLQCGKDDSGWRVSAGARVIHEWWESVSILTDRAEVWLIPTSFGQLLWSSSQPLCVPHNSLVFMLSWELAERGVWNRSAGCCFSLSETEKPLAFYPLSFWWFAAGDDTDGSSKCNRHFTNTVRPSIKKNK